MLKLPGRQEKLNEIQGTQEIGSKLNDVSKLAVAVKSLEEIILASVTAYKFRKRKKGFQIR